MPLILMPPLLLILALTVSAANVSSTWSSSLPLVRVIALSSTPAIVHPPPWNSMPPTSAQPGMVTVVGVAAVPKTAMASFTHWSPWPPGVGAHTSPPDQFAPGRPTQYK